MRMPATLCRQSVRPFKVLWGFRQPFVPRQTPCHAVDHATDLWQVRPFIPFRAMGHACPHGPVNLHATPHHQMIHHSTLSAVPDEFVGPEVVGAVNLGTRLFNDPRNPFHDLPIKVFIELIINRREGIVEFFFSFAFEDEPYLLGGEYDFGGTVGTKARQLGPDPAERGGEARNDGSGDTTEGETLKLAVWHSQVKGCR